MRHISYKPLWHTLLGKNKGISMETLEKICDALKCEITDVIELTDELPETKEAK